MYLCWVFAVAPCVSPLQAGEAFRAKSARADELLGLCGETHEADASQELLDALLRLQARGVGCSGAALEAQLRAHAPQLLHGLTVLAWVDRIDAALPPPMHAPLAALLGVPEWRATDVLRDLAAQYCAERLYLQRLRIVKLATRTFGSFST